MKDEDIKLMYETSILLRKYFFNYDKNGNYHPKKSKRLESLKELKKLRYVEEMAKEAEEKEKSYEEIEKERKITTLKKVSSGVEKSLKSTIEKREESRMLRKKIVQKRLELRELIKKNEKNRES